MSLNNQAGELTALKLKIESILGQGLRDGNSDLDILPNGRMVGHVISSEFDGLDYEDRRKRIRNLLDEKAREGVLSPDDLLRVSTLLTYTPSEWAVATTDLKD